MGYMLPIGPGRGPVRHVRIVDWARVHAFGYRHIFLDGRRIGDEWPERGGHGDWCQ